MMQIEGEKQDKKSTKNRVKVAIRVRPMSRTSLRLVPIIQQIIIGHQRQYKYDRVFKQTSTQEEVYEECIKDLVLKCFDGYNSAVLAYGQTGSGKTYTMGTNTTIMSCNQEGIIPKAIKEIFNEVELRKDKDQFIIKASFLQIYNEQMIDLLDRKHKQNGISIREEKDGSVNIYGATEEKVIDSNQMLGLLDRGSVNRTTASTMMNQISSRSHAIFMISIEQHSKIKQSIEDEFITAKFYFVDLAGSERVKKTGATGVALKEGININLGLLELGNVISALASTDRKQSQFITFRNSKLTRILQDSLGGNSNTYMIACISPSQSNYEESLNTLKYASKAMNIKNKPVINRDPHSAQINQLKKRILQLEEMNAHFKELLKNQGIKVQSIVSYKSNDQDLKKLQVRNQILERKNQKIFLQLKDEKKRKNQIQISQYQLQRQRDILVALLEELKTNHPEINVEISELYEKQNVSLIENYLTKIHQLQTDILQKQKITTHLQIQYTKLHEISQRDEQILLKKNQGIHQLKRQNKQLKKIIQQLKKQMTRKDHKDEVQSESSDENSFIDEQEELSQDSHYNSQAQAFNHHENHIKTQLKNVEKFINEKQSILNDITNQQMQLEYKLIQEMKQQYHQKIHQIEKEKNNLLNQQRNQNHKQNKKQYSHKIQSLQVELKQYRNRIKEQKNLEKKVSTQNNTIKGLANEIKTFKVQKIELNRKLKQDKENFQKYKQKRSHQIFTMKKENNKKDFQIRKLTNQNKNKAMVALKKGDQFKRVKKINETLKRLMKPKRANGLKAKANPKKEQQTEIKLSQKMLESFIEVSFKKLLLKIDRDFDIDKYSKKCDEITKEIDNLIKQQSSLCLKLERLELKQQDGYSNFDQNLLQDHQKQEQYRLGIHEHRQRISNLEENLQFCESKYKQLLSNVSQNYQYNIQTEIIYNKDYNSLEKMRDIVKVLYKNIEKIIIENYRLKVSNQEIMVQNNMQQIQIKELKQTIFKKNVENQQNLNKLREQMMIKYYQNLIDQENNENFQANLIQKNYQQPAKGNIWQRQKKSYERKIMQLTKSNNKLTSQIEMWRRKCNIIQQKYQSMKSLFNKDKFIGRPSRQQDSNSVPSTPFNNTKQHKRLSYLQGNSQGKSNYLIDELNSMTEQMKNNSFAKAKRSLNYINESSFEDDENVEVNNSFNSQIQFNRNKWECLATIDAHNSPILSVKNLNNYLISSATRSVKLWDLQTNHLEIQLTGVYLNSFVKSLAISKEKQILAASCDKIITLWDLRTANNQQTLRGHRDEIRTMNIVGNYLFSGGKGLGNSGGLLVWDLRYLNHNAPMEEKQRNQDIFSLVSHKNLLYYGTRDHHVRRLNLQSLETLPAFQPPHMDTVSSLAISKGYLISGSKDKNLRLWSLDSSIYNLKSTIHAFNDYINAVESDSYLPIFYSSDRTGQVKVGTIFKERIEFIGMFSHTQSVNAMTSLDNNQSVIVSGSSDKTIKLWQPNNETFHHIQSSFC